MENVVILNLNKGIRILQVFFVDLSLLSLPIIYFVFKKKNPLEELKVTKFDFKRELIRTAKLLVLLVLASFVLTPIFSFLGFNDIKKVYSVVDKLRENSPLLLSYLLVVRVTVEEIFFRGFLVNKVGVIGSALVFGLAHIFYGSTAEVLGAIVLGLILAFAFKENHNLYPNIFAHMLYNVVVISLAGVFYG